MQLPPNSQPDTSSATSIPFELLPPKPLPQELKKAPVPTQAQNTIANFNANSAAGGQTKKSTPTPAQKQPEPPTSTITDKDFQGAQAIDTNPAASLASNAAEGAINLFGKISVGQGLGLAFLVLIGLIWLLIPTASGYTRLQLLWLTIIGRTSLTYNKTITGTAPSGGPSEAVSDSVDNSSNQQSSLPVQANISLAGINFSALDMYAN